MTSPFPLRVHAFSPEIISLEFEITKYVLPQTENILTPAYHHIKKTHMLEISCSLMALVKPFFVIWS